MGAPSETYVTIDQYPSVNGTVTIGVDRSNGHGVYDIDGSKLYLTNYEPEDRAEFQPIRIINVIDQPTEVVTLVKGRTALCPIRYQLISFVKSAAQGSGIYVGQCGQPYYFRAEENRIAIVEDGPENPIIQYYSQHNLTTPMREALATPPPQPATPPAEPATPPAEPATAPAPGPPPTWLIVGAGFLAEMYFESSADDTHDCATKAFSYGLVDTVNDNILEEGISAYFNSNGSNPEAAAKVDELKSSLTVLLSEHPAREGFAQAIERLYPDHKFAIAMTNNVISRYSACEAAKGETGDHN